MESFIAQIIVGLATGGIYALLVLGMNLLVLVRNIVHHSYSHIVVLTMAMGWLTLTHTGNNIPLCIVVMLVSAIVFTIATEPLFRPLSVRGADLETVTLAMGIGIQNFPEGAAVALPLRQGGWSRPRAFVGGLLSGAVEPVFGVLAALAAAGVDPLMPWLLSFAAGAMLYVVVEELIPQAHSRAGTCGFVMGFLVMMVLDVALGG